MSGDENKPPISFQGTFDVNKGLDQFADLIQYIDKHITEQQAVTFEIWNESGWDLTSQGAPIRVQGEQITVPGESSREPVIKQKVDNNAGYVVFEAAANGFDGVIIGFFYSNGGKAPYVMFGSCVRNLGGQGSSSFLSAYCGGVNYFERWRKPGNDAPMAVALSNPGAIPVGIPVGEWETGSPQSKNVIVGSKFGTAFMNINGSLTWISGAKNHWHARFIVTSGVD